jgi:hypothetical protein
MSICSCRGGDVMTVMEELGRLIRSAPGPGSSAMQVAHWYELKAHMLEHLAEEDEAGRPTALRQAEAAHRHAKELVRAGR